MVLITLPTLVSAITHFYSIAKKCKASVLWCAHLGLNQDSNDYESFALPLSYRRTLKLDEHAGEP